MQFTWISPPVNRRSEGPTYHYLNLCSNRLLSQESPVMTVSLFFVLFSHTMVSYSLETPATARSENSSGYDTEHQQREARSPALFDSPSYPRTSRESQMLSNRRWKCLGQHQTCAPRNVLLEGGASVASGSQTREILTGQPAADQRANETWLGFGVPC